MAKKNKGKTTVTIFPDWCKGCGLCVAFCPSKVFEMDPTGKARVAQEDECVNCGFCELHCPDFAIMIKPKDTENGRSGAGTRAANGNRTGNGKNA